MLWDVADAFMIDAVRSPIGRRNGSLSGIRADELAAQVLNGLVGRLDLDPGEGEDVQMGGVTQVGEHAVSGGRGARRRAASAGRSSRRASRRRCSPRSGT